MAVKAGYGRLSSGVLGLGVSVAARCVWVVCVTAGQATASLGG